MRSDMEVGPATERRRWPREWEAWALVALSLAIYGSRLTELPIRGEESRWARGATEMIEQGDWVLPRQQGLLFADRPPLAMWTIAVAGSIRGEVDLAAVRAPTLLAMLLLPLLIYGYGRIFLTRLGAFAAAAAFLTLGQVLQLGRVAENEAVYTLIVSGSLLIWHAGYSRGWPTAATWMAGYALAALAALTKGPQGPAYFCGPVGLYLLLRRDWRYLVSWGHAAGIATFVGIVAAWTAPFWLATDWAMVRMIWIDCTAIRFATDEPLWRHMLTYPVELLACLAPWSVWLAMYAFRDVRRGLLAVWPQGLFLLVAIGVTFPTVWFAAAARARYYMPLFPCFSLLIGLAIERCLARENWPRLAWMWRLSLGTLLIVSGGASAALIVAPWWNSPRLAAWSLPPWFIALYAGAACGLAAAACWAWRDRGAWTGHVGVAAWAAFLGLTVTGVVVTAQSRTSEDTATAVAEVRQRLPADVELVSLGRVHHIFAWHYKKTIPQVAWPGENGTLDPHVTYFCFDRLQHDPAELPFAWEEVGVVSCDRLRGSAPRDTVVVGRRVDVPAVAGRPAARQAQ